MKKFTKEEYIKILVMSHKTKACDIKDYHNIEKEFEEIKKLFLLNKHMYE